MTVPQIIAAWLTADIIAVSIAFAFLTTGAAKASHAKHRAHVLARAEELRRDTAAGLVAGRGR